MKKYLLLLALVCLLGNWALAQTNRPTYTTTTEVKETIDFTGWNWADNGDANASVTWENNSISSITGTNGSTLNRTYTNLNHSFFVGTSSQSSGTTSTTIYDDPDVIFNTFDGSVINFTISNNQFTNANVGDIIRVNFKDKGDDYEPKFKIVSTWNDFSDLQNIIDHGDDYFQAVINQNALNELQSNGLRLQGLGFTLTSVELISTPNNPANTWRLWRSNDNNETYLQKYSSSNDYFNITNLQAGDEVTIWGDNGQNGGCNITSGNANPQSISFNGNGQKITMQSNGTLQLQFTGQWSGIRKIEIKSQVDQKTVFDYDPGYEEYDMYDEFSWAKNNNPATTYSLTGSAGFQLNGADAQYAKFSGSKITTNNRIALNVAPNYGSNDYGENVTNNDEWAFDFGLVPPGNDGDYSFLSICNLREGDRVVISYINEYGNIEDGNPLIFASRGNTETGFYYDGSSAFKDDDRDGVLDEGEVSISNGQKASVDWHRGEGNVGNTDNGYGSGVTPELYYINSYVMTEDGHLDLAFRRFVQDKTDSDPKLVSRIVKIKIFSDHQAMMVDKYDNGSYTAYYNITGELQAKEHIMPGGLEIHVGNNDATQHAIVVSSKDGPVSYINSAENYKIPGVSKSNNKLSINFDLGITGNGNIANLPSSGTYYRFIPEASGKMKFKFEAKSMNYYRWDLRGNGTYYNTDLKDNNGNYGDWGALNDRPNEQTVDAACPYYLVTVKNGQIRTVQKLNNNQDINNGGDWETPDYINVTEGEEYYLFGGWNQTGLYYKSSFPTPGDPYNSTIQNWDGTSSANPSYVNDTDRQYNNIEFRPFDGRTVGCGVAELLWVEFKRNDEIYPLAKWVPNGTTAVNDVNENNSERHGVPNPDTYVMEYELANIVGFTNYDNNITVKKMSGNITGCRPYIVRDAHDQTKGKLMIDNIQFANNENPGGTILIKIGDATKRTDPLYALTIAYSTDPKYDKKVNPQDEQSKVIRGHIWDFHTSSLQGFRWDGSDDRTSNGATPTELGTYFANYYGTYGNEIQSSQFETVKEGSAKNESSLLYEEISIHGDWLFNYNLKYDEKMFDPVFTNKYDMEGDNADMIWDTEGTVFQTSANQSCIFNEYGSDITHDEPASTDIDPNRYVGILKGGKFRIPWLRKNDRVIIWMGSGTGRTDDFVSLKIKNAYDALYNEINPEDEYIVGGSQWYKDDSNYHGCYHFFAKGDENSPAEGKAADMVFEMVGGEMCKIYKIQIYRGDRIITNEVVGTDDNNNKFLLWSTAADPNDGIGQAKGPDYNWTLNYFGKNQRLADGKRGNTVQTEEVLPNQDNEIIVKSGYMISDLTDNHSDPDDETSEVVSFTYTHDYGQIGTFRMRGKDMEKNRNYVADYADHNVTIAYQETMEYPYTWDFKDMIGWDTKHDNNFYWDEQLGTYMVNRPKWFDNDTQWNASYEKTSADLSLWGIPVGNATGYALRLNTQKSPDKYPQDNIFESVQTLENNKPYYGNQLWANSKVVPESQGLWFHTPDQNTLNGSMRVYSDGMSVGGVPKWQYNMVVPNVPAGAVVYMRIKKATSYLEHKYKFAGSDASDLTLTPVDPKATNPTEWVASIKNNNSEKKHLTLSFVGYTLEKLAVSMDSKSIGKTGFATESRARVIDHSLTEYFTLAPVKAYQASFDNEDKPTKVILSQIRFMPAAPDFKKNEQNEVINDGLTDNEGLGCVLYHDVEANSDESIGKSVTGVFHLFVPDMHDNETDLADWGSLVCNTQTNILRSCVPAATNDNDRLAATDNGDTRYILSAKPYQNAGEGYLADDGGKAGLVGFYKVDPQKGANKTGNIAYMQLSSSQISNSKISMVFFDEMFGEINNGIATGISEVNEENASNGKAEWYSLDGQKLNGVPTAKGLYIVNGKKVLVK